MASLVLLDGTVIRVTICDDCYAPLRDEGRFSRICETIDEYGEVIRVHRSALCKSCHDLSLYGDDCD